MMAKHFILFIIKNGQSCVVSGRYSMTRKRKQLLSERDGITMCELFSKIHEIMNQIKDMTVGYSISEERMLFEYKGKRYVAEIHEIENPAEDIRDDMRRIRYL